jgi:hypothetical protein
VRNPIDCDLLGAPSVPVKHGGQSAGRLIYYFAEKAITQPDASLESDILNSIERNQTDLHLYKTMGLSPTDYYSYETFPIYRLKSEINHAHFDFDLSPYENGFLCYALLLLVQPEYQGSFFNVRDFLIGRVAKTLFDLRNNRILMLHGHATVNQFRVRTKIDWRNRKTADGTKKIVRLYQRMGFTQTHQNSDNVVLLSEQTRKEYAALSSPLEQRLADLQGKMAR